METIKQTTLKEGYYEDGLTVKLVAFDNGMFGIYHYIHCEDRFSEYGSYHDLYEAENAYKQIIIRYEVQQSMIAVATKRREEGATDDDINRYKQYLSSIWDFRNDKDMLDFIKYCL